MPTVKEIQSIANDRGVVIPKRIKKSDMIHILQLQEGNTDCYATRSCENIKCLWYKDCQKDIRKRSY